MTESTPAIRTVTVPDAELLAALQPVPEGVTVLLWDMEGPLPEEEAENVDVVVLPYNPNPAAQLPLLAALPNLKLVHTQSTGYDGVREAVGPGIAVASAAGVHAATTAELAIGLMLASLRGIDAAARDQAEGLWRPQRRKSLADRAVTLVGVGGIGAEIAARLAPFEIELTRVGSTARDDAQGHVHGVDELIELAPTTEILVLITPLTEATRGLVDARLLAALPDGALVVNVARGAVVDSDALTAEVVSGRLHAALDVFDPEPLPAGHPLWCAPNALITPHVGGNTSAFFPRIVRLLNRQLEAFAAGRKPENVVQDGPYAR